MSALDPNIPDPTRICNDCRFQLRRSDSGREPLCTNPRLGRDLVTGKTEDAWCTHQRREFFVFRTGEGGDRRCGPAGQWFKPRGTAPPRRETLPWAERWYMPVLMGALICTAIILLLVALVTHPSVPR